MDTALVPTRQPLPKVMRTLLVGSMLLAICYAIAAVVPLRAQAACADPYTVQPGDGWFKIANRCGVAYPTLIEANRALWERQGETLYVGDVLRLIPVPTPVPAITPSAVATPWPITPTPINSLSSPRETVRFFWQAVINGTRTGDFRTAYAYVGPQLQGALPYATFAADFASTKEITIQSIAIVQEDATRAVVDAVIIAAHQAGGDWHYQRDRYRYTLSPVNGQWRFTAMQRLDIDPADSCPNTIPTRLQRGMRAYVLPQPPIPNRVFQEPNRQSPLVGRIEPGAAMTLRDGPRCAQNSVWWYVQADSGIIGWTAEGQPGEYWLAPLATAGTPSVGPITFCTQVDRADRCLDPTTQFPLGLKRLEVNWNFQNLPLNTPVKHLWYHRGNLFFQREYVVWPANRASMTGLGYTFYSPLGGLPTGDWRLELRRAADNMLLQSGYFTVGTR